MKTFHQVVKLAAGQKLWSSPGDQFSRCPALNETDWNPWYISRDSTALAFTAESLSEVSRDVTVWDGEAKVTRRFTGCGLQEAVNDFQDFREHFAEVVVSLQNLPVFQARKLSQSWCFP